MAIKSKPGTKRTRHKRRKRTLLEIAARRVGESSKERLLWLLEFAQRPRTQIVSDLGGSGFRELAVFGVLPTGVQPAEIAATIEQLIAGARALLSGSGIWRIPMGTNTARVVSREQSTRTQGRRARIRYRFGYETTDFRTAFLMRAADVLSDGGLIERLAECARSDCQRLFLRRKRGAFCTRRCAQLEHVRRWRARHSARELSDKRHDYYVARKARLQNRPLEVMKEQVQRRPRVGIAEPRRS
jgi:hypothetical protein